MSGATPKTLRKRRNGLFAKGACVYVMREMGSTVCKIGFSNDVEQRFGIVQIGNPRQLELIISVLHPEASRLEVELHRRFKAQHIRGEWFDLSEADLEEIRRIPPAPAPDVVAEPELATSLRPPVPRRADAVMEKWGGLRLRFSEYHYNRELMPADLQLLWDEYDREMDQAMARRCAGLNY